jgi:muramidase (phage lysozyme)
MSTYKDKDPATDLLLDFIAGGVPGNPRGEANGNYNAYFAHGDSTYDLSKLSLTEIYQFQQRMLADDPRSTALGRYQFLRGTLQGLQKARKLSADTKLTHELQDDLGVALLVRRGFSKWWKDEISDDQLANGCSMEWASLPDPDNGGKSHYDGDSVGNHASTSLANFRAAIARAKELRSQQPSPTPPPEPTPIPTPTPRPNPEPSGDGEIKLGDRGTQIRLIQLILDVVDDGVYGQITADAVKQFQKDNRIKQTGTVNKRTWQKIFAWQQ